MNRLVAKKSKFSHLMMTTALVAAGMLGVSGALQAAPIGDYELPTAPTVEAGVAGFSTPSFDKLDVNQSTDRAVINWGAFNIGADATVQFYQPSANSLTVNRVSNDGQFSSIRGHLIANGKIVILDPNGIIFGKNSVMNVGSIVASTGDVYTDSVMNNTTAQRLKFHSFGNSEVVNYGLINAADSGLVAFVAPTVRNHGIINANMGRVELAAGNEVATVDLYGDGLIELAYTDKNDALTSENKGTISAVGGKISMTAAAAKDVVDSVVNMKGIAQANSVSVVNGQIILSAKKVRITKNAQIRGATKITAKSVVLNATIDGAVTGKADNVKVKSDNAKIAQALNIINQNGTIKVGAGTYNEHLVVDKAGVKLLGAFAGIKGDDLTRGVNETIIIPNSPGITINAGNVTIDGFTFTGAVGADGYGIFVDNADVANIRNNIITNNSQNGVYLLNSWGSTLFGNMITRTGSHGVYALKSDKLTMEANQIGVLKGGAFNINGDGILLENSGQAYLYNNRIAQTTNTATNVGNGIHLIRSGNADVRQNTIYDVAWDGVRITKSGDVTAQNNDIHHVKRVGVYATASWNANILNNQIDDTLLRGVMVERMSGASLIKNNKIDISGIDGITVRLSDDTTVENNTIGYGKDGLFNTADDSVIDRHGVRILDSDNVLAKNNKIAHTGGSGIFAANNSNLRIGDYLSQNVVNFTGSHGIYVENSAGAEVIANQVGVMKGGNHNINGDGILLVSSDESLIERNRVAKTTTTADEVGSGIHVKNSNNVDVIDNTSYELDWDGVKVTGGDTVRVLNNDVDHALRAGIFAKNGSNITFDGNDVLDTGMVGVMVQDILESSTITNNAIDMIGLDAVNVLRSDNVLVQNNVIGYGDDGVQGTTDDTVIARDGIRVDRGANVSVLDNMVTGVAGHSVKGLKVGSTFDVSNNTIDASGVNGISVFNTEPANIMIVGNNITNLVDGLPLAANAGIELDAGMGSTVQVSGNSIDSGFTYGVLARSGIIDLTGETNTILNTSIGLAFYPDAEQKFEGDYFTFLANKLQLVGDTIGTTAFVDQSELFIDLGYGAFFAPGLPTVLNGNDATYTLGASTIAPSTNVSGTITPAERLILEPMINHYIDSQDRGLFFPEPVVAAATITIDQKDVLRPANLRLLNTNGGALTITGLPSVGGGATAPAPASTAFDPNAIEPAAGDEETPSNGQSVAGIAPAAGGENTPCWSDANQALGEGSAVTFNFGSSPDALMQDAVSCGNQQQPNGNNI